MLGTLSPLRSTSFRLMVWYAAVFGASVAVLGSVVYWTTGAALEQQIRDSVERETRLLVNVYRDRGPENTIRGINRRLEELKSPRMYFLLQETTGERIAGNLPTMPPVEGWAMMTVPASSLGAIEGDDDRSSGRSMVALGSRLPDGKFLLVAENRYRAIKSKEATLIAMGWGIAATVLLGLLGGMLINAGFMRRIEDINRTSRAIVAGNLSNRVPTRGSGDEMDQLAVNLNAMLDRIQSLMESLKRVSDDVAHDLRTPLSRLRRRLEVASDRANAGADGTTVIEESIADVDAILETFAALLRIAQIESGTRRAAFAEVNLAQVASAVAETYAAVAEDRGQRVRADVSGSAVVHGDRELLTQMLANLMENSIRHSPAGTDVVVTLAMENGEAILGIADTGPGIPARERDKVLQRFYRLEASRTLPGSGLGLALVKAVADLHGASLELLDNAPGLRVIVRFRAQRSTAARNGLAYPVPAESGATR